MLTLSVLVGSLALLALFTMWRSRVAGGANAPAELAPGAPVARIWVMENGAIELDGKPVELDALGKALDDLARQRGIVLYGRDAPDQEPPPVSMKILELVTDRRLPIRLSTQRDYSDVVGPGGRRG